MGFCVLQQMRSQSALVYRATSKLDLELCCFASNLIHGMRYAKNLTKKFPVWDSSRKRQAKN